MPRFRLVTLVSPLAGREAEMNEWYDERHVPELLAVPGVRAAERFKMRNPLVPSESAWSYLNLIEIEAEDPMAVYQEILDRTLDGEIARSDAYRLISMGICEALGERLLAPR